MVRARQIWATRRSKGPRTSFGGWGSSVLSPAAAEEEEEEERASVRRARCCGDGDGEAAAAAAAAAAAEGAADPEGAVALRRRRGIVLGEGWRLGARGEEEGADGTIVLLGLLVTTTPLVIVTGAAPCPAERRGCARIIVVPPGFWGSTSDRCCFVCEKPLVGLVSGGWKE
jgi:hypothetical protein